MRSGSAKPLSQLVQPLRPRPLQLLGADRIAGGERIDGRADRRARLVDVLRRRERGADEERARLGQRQGEAEGAGRELALDQVLVQAAARGVAQHLGEQRRRGEVGARCRRHVIAEVDQRRAADAAQRHRALAVLRRVEGVGRRDRPRRPRDRAEALRHELEHPRGVEAAGDDQGRVVRLVVVAVERLQPGNVDVLDVGAGADRALAVVVPLVHGGQGLLQMSPWSGCSRPIPSRCARPSSRCRGRPGR